MRLLLIFVAYSCRCPAFMQMGCDAGGTLSLLKSEGDASRLLVDNARLVEDRVRRYAILLKCG